VRDAQLHLVRDERLLDRGLEELDLRRRVVRDAEVPDLARRLQGVERGRDLLRLDERVGPVEEQEVEVVGLERRMCSSEKSKKPGRMPTFDWMTTCSRSAAVRVTAPPNRRSQPWRSEP
jgi:hypothetical protein